MYSGKKAQHDFPKMRGGGSKAVWNFSKNSSVLEEPSFPYTSWDMGLYNWVFPYPMAQKRPQWHQNSEGPMVSIKGSFQALEIGFLVHRPKAKIIPCWKFRAHFWLDEKKTTIWRFQLLLLEPRPNFVEHRKSSSFGIQYESWKVWKVWAASSHLQTFDIAIHCTAALLLFKTILLTFRLLSGRRWNELAKLRRHASRVHVTKIYFG